jgi:peptide/nickel transport system permease protein
VGLYVVKRTLHSIMVLFLVSIVCFAAMHMMPGNPWAGIGMTLEQKQEVQAQIHLHKLDRPILMQYAFWVKGLLDGYLGFDYNGTPIGGYIWSFVRNSLYLMAAAWILAMLIGIPWALYNSRRQYGLSDKIAVILAFAGFAAPAFWLGTMLQDLFAMRLLWLPPSSMYDSGHIGEPANLLIHMILPVTTLTVGIMVYYLKYFRESLREVLPSDYLITARAKGVPERRVIYRHALKNAAIPVITMMALDVPAIISGSAAVEVVFNWHGMGILLVSSAERRDLPVLMALIMIVTAAVIVSNWLADLLYVMIDPRVRLSGSKDHA